MSPQRYYRGVLRVNKLSCYFKHGGTHYEGLLELISRVKKKVQKSPLSVQVTLYTKILVEKKYIKN